MKKENASPLTGLNDKTQSQFDLTVDEWIRLHQKRATQLNARRQEGEGVDNIYYIQIDAGPATNLEQFEEWADDEDCCEFLDATTLRMRFCRDFGSHIEMTHYIQQMKRSDTTVEIHLYEDEITLLNERKGRGWYKAITRLIAIIGPEDDNEIYYCDEVTEEYDSSETWIGPPLTKSQVLSDVEAE